MENLPDSLPLTLDSIKQIAPNGAEYWMARDLMVPLGYEDWGNFEHVIQKAKMAAEGAGADPANHFRDVTKMVGIGSGAQRERADCYLSRYARLCGQ